MMNLNNEIYKKENESLNSKRSKRESREKESKNVKRKEKMSSKRDKISILPRKSLVHMSIHMCET